MSMSDWFEKPSWSDIDDATVSELRERILVAVRGRGRRDHVYRALGAALASTLLDAEPSLDEARRHAKTTHDLVMAMLDEDAGPSPA
jgi:hypothetical protein